MGEKKERDRKRKEKEEQEDIDSMNKYTEFYKFGKNGTVGGGNPMRDASGNIMAEYGAFAAPDSPELDQPFSDLKNKNIAFEI